MAKFRIWEKSIEDERLRGVLRSFGGDVETSTEWKDGDYDADVILGSWKDRDVEHHNLKRQVVKKSKNLIVIETPIGS